MEQSKYELGLYTLSCIHYRWRELKVVIIYLRHESSASSNFEVTQLLQLEIESESVAVNDISKPPRQR